MEESKTRYSTLSVRLPKEFKALYQDAASARGITLSAWVVMALGSYYRKWREPIEMSDVVRANAAQYDCWKCQVSADRCEAPAKHQAASEWTLRGE